MFPLFQSFVLSLSLSLVQLAIAPNSPGSATTTTATTPTAAANANSSTGRAQINGGRFDFEDGGTYCGGWDEGMNKQSVDIKQEQIAHSYLLILGSFVHESFLMSLKMFSICFSFFPFLFFSFALLKQGKHMDMACVRDQSIRALIQVHGTMALKCLVFTSGQGKERKKAYKIPSLIHFRVVLMSPATNYGATISHSSVATHITSTHNFVNEMNKNGCCCCDELKS